jgi:pimeloyl-ACP methyl ester carboxylesterase
MQTRSSFLTSAGAFAALAAASELRALAGPNDTASVILVHAAWEDGSVWSKVIVALAQQGVYTVAAPIPLTTMGDDVAMVEHVIARTSGPVVLVSHAYSGAVISSVRNPRVRSLVFINSLLPAKGETVADVFYRKPPHPKAPHMKPDENGLVWMPRWAFAHSIAPKATSAELAVLAASQRPLSVPCIQKKLGPPAWKFKPSLYLVAEQDDLIDVDTQRFMANRAGSKVRSYPDDHTAMVTAPQHVIDLVSEALKAV